MCIISEQLISSGNHKAAQLVRQADFLFCRPVSQLARLLFLPQPSPHHLVCLHNKVPLLSALQCPLISLRLDKKAACGIHMSVNTHTLTHMAWFVPSDVGETERENKRNWNKAPAWHTLRRKCVGSVSELWTVTHTHMHLYEVRRGCSSGVLQCIEACEWGEKPCVSFIYMQCFRTGDSCESHIAPEISFRRTLFEFQAWLVLIFLILSLNEAQRSQSGHQYPRREIPSTQQPYCKLYLTILHIHR